MSGASKIGSGATEVPLEIRATTLWKAAHSQMRVALGRRKTTLRTVPQQFGDRCKVDTALAQR
jgi:hypothetical protein